MIISAETVLRMDTVFAAVQEQKKERTADRWQKYSLWKMRKKSQDSWSLN